MKSGAGGGCAGARYRDAGDGRDDGAAVAAAGRSRASGDHGIDAHHARRGHCAACAAPRRGRLRAETLGRRIGDEFFRLELLAKVKGLARLRQRAKAPMHETSGLRLRAAPIMSPRLLAIGQFHRWAAGAVHAGAGAGQDTQRAGGADAAHAADVHPDPGRAYQQARRHALRRSEGRRGVAGGPHLSRAGRPAPAGRAGARRPACALSTAIRRRISAALRSIRCCAAPPTACEGRVLVAMLTGMGHDGLEGTRRVVEAGGGAMAQDEATSVVWGMPGAVARPGLCHAVLPLPRDRTEAAGAAARCVRA